MYRHYRPGQEIDLQLSEKYVEAYRAAEEWMQVNS
jgi:hypothetical protein